MLILGIETSGERGSVALCSGERLLESYRFPEGARHARHIMTGVDAVVRRAGVESREIEAVAVSEGPGSFTGLRVGVTCAKTLAYVLGWQAVGVPSLAVLVQNVDPELCGRPFACPVRDARRRFVYANVFRCEGGRWQDVSGLLTGAPEEVAGLIPRPALVFGSGVEAYPDAFPPDPREAERRGLRLGEPSLAEGKAEHVARLGLRRLREGKGVSPMQLVARYYRRTAAEEKVLGHAGDAAPGPA